MADAGTQEGGRRPVKTIVVALGVILLLAVFPWQPMERQETKRVFEPVWQAKLGSLMGADFEGLFVDGPRLAVVVRGGMGGCEGIVLDRVTGDRLVTKSLGSPTAPIASAVAPWPGTILVYGYGDQVGLQLLQSSDFSTVWTKPLESWVGCWTDWGEEVVIVAPDTPSKQLKLRRYRRKDGEMHDIAAVPFTFLHYADILGVGNRLVVTLGGEPLRTLTADGEWETVAPERLSNGGLARDQDVLLVGSDDTVTCREVPSLQQRWSVKPDLVPPGGTPSGWSFEHRPLQVGYDVVVTADALSGEVVALKLTNGAERWRTSLGSPVYPGWMRQAAGGFVVITQQDKHVRLHWLDASTGDELGTLDVPAQSAYSLVLATADDCVYVAHGRQVDCWRLVRPTTPPAPE